MSKEIKLSHIILGIIVIYMIFGTQGQGMSIGGFGGCSRTTDTPQAPNCECSDWQNTQCGNGCDSNQMKQTRVCTNDCGIEFQCVADVSCGNTCIDTCLNLNKECGTHTICDISTNCGSCQSGFNCEYGQCIACTPICNTCGADDGCGNPCQTGTCPTGKICSNGQCITSIVCSGLNMEDCINNNACHPIWNNPICTGSGMIPSCDFEPSSLYAGCQG